MGGSKTVVLCALLLLLAPIASSAPLGAANCQTHVIHHYNAQGVLIGVDVVCSGLCDDLNDCEEFSAGSLVWCQCSPGGALDDCTGVAVTGGIRCVDVSCSVLCVPHSIEWTTPKTGHTHVQYWCTCG